MKLRLDFRLEYGERELIPWLGEYGLQYLKGKGCRVSVEFDEEVGEMFQPSHLPPAIEDGFRKSMIHLVRCAAAKQDKHVSYTNIAAIYKQWPLPDYPRGDQRNDPDQEAAIWVEGNDGSA